MTPRPRVLTYAHDGFGLGHIRRNLRLVTSLVEEVPNLAALMVTGSPVSDHFALPVQVDYLKLPSLSKVANDHYVSRRLGLGRGDITAIRSALLTAAVEGFAPDLILVDFYPLGVNRELEQALERIRVVSPSTQLVLGWRDILDHPDQVRREWGLTGQLAGIDRLFDKVLVYGSAEIYDPIAEYDLPASVAARTIFTGYLVDRPRTHRTAPGDRPTAVCTLGGGEDGRRAAEAFLGAMRLLRPAGWTGVLVTGPLMPVDDQRLLAGAAGEMGVACTPFEDDLEGLLARADVVVTMAGYNTVCEVLAAGVPAVLLPRSEPRREQFMRASKLAEYGLARYLVPETSSARDLADLIEIQAAAGHATPAQTLDLGGLRRAAAVLGAAAVRTIGVPA